MKVALRLIGWTFLLALGLLALLAANLFTSAIRPARAVGMEVVAAPDPGHAAVSIVVFYPTDAQPHLALMGLSLVEVAQGAPITSGPHPLVVISHGTGAAPTSHIDTVMALVEQGYIVAAPIHNGDNFQDQSQVGAPTWMVDRARHVVRVNDFLLTAWRGRDSIDPEKIGLFGFSAGATTALINIGATPDFALVNDACETRPEFVCQLMQPSAVLQSPNAAEYRDDRIRAAVLAAPGFGLAFTEASLESVTLPVRMWVGGADVNTPAASNAAAIAALMPNHPALNTVPGAGHLSFLAPCPMLGSVLAPMLCSDRNGFDRAAFHHEFNVDVVAVFAANLNAAAPPTEPP